jgi:hypothetical protein
LSNKGTTFSTTLLIPPKLSQQLDSTHNPFHQKLWLPEFKIFKI